MSVYVFALRRRRVLEAELVEELRLLALALVPLLAGDLAGPAADAVGDVDQGRPDRDGFEAVEALGVVMTASLSPRADAVPDDVDETGLRLLRSRSGIRGVDREVVDAGAGREALESPVVGHPDDRDLAVADLQRLHAGRHQGLHVELAARGRDPDPVARPNAELLPEIHRHLQHRFGHQLVQPGNVARGRTGAPVLGDRRGHQHVGELVGGADRLVRLDARILEHRIALHLRMEQVLDRALDRLVHLRQRPVLRHVGHVARIPGFFSSGSE